MEYPAQWVARRLPLSRIYNLARNQKRSDLSEHRRIQEFRSHFQYTGRLPMKESRRSDVYIDDHVTDMSRLSSLGEVKLAIDHE